MTREKKRTKVKPFSHTLIRTISVKMRKRKSSCCTSWCSSSVHT